MYTAILHATDLADNHFAMCQKALAIAKRFDARLYLLHVLEMPTSVQLAQGLGFAEIQDPTDMQEDAKAVMNLIGDTLKIPKKHLFVETGSIKQHVFDKVNELSCELIIIGHHTPSRIPVYLGSTAQLIVHEAHCDVLTVS